MTDDGLVAFLRARLDEDGKVAQAANRGPWQVGEDNGGSRVYVRPPAGVDWIGWTRTDSAVFGAQVSNMPKYRENAAHVARHDPARVLAEVDAKRRILDEHHEDDGDCTTCAKGEWGWPTLSSSARPVAFPCPTVRLLALPYAGHPAYRKEWSP